MRTPVDLLVPLKSLHRAKSRLRGAADGGLGDPARHARLTLALARDTIAAATAAALVGTLTVVSSDATVARALRADGVRVLPDPPGGGLNAALRHGAAMLASTGVNGVVGALQADLPALRASELDAALDAAFAAFAAGADAVFCADEQGTGTTLLLCAPGVALLPRFGPGSAQRHTEQGAVALAGHWPGLRRDVDTAADLAAADALGLGVHTSAVLTAGSGHHPCDAGPMREQATVLDVHADGAVTLVSDDGQRSHAERAAVDTGGWLAPRPGQRVDVLRAEDGTVSAVLVPGM